jgi:hypothetical protein
VLSVILLAVINPQHGATAIRIGIGAGTFAVLTLLLRRRAARRWRKLDWRIARMPARLRAA